jgi:hypothetical protein
MSFVFLASPPHPIADPGCLCSQFGFVEQFLDIAHPIGPLPKAFAGNRAAGAATSTTNLLIGAAPAISAAASQRTRLAALLLPLSLGHLRLTTLAFLSLLSLLLLIAVLSLLLFPLLSTLSLAGL